MFLDLIQKSQYPILVQSALISLGILIFLYILKLIARKRSKNKPEQNQTNLEIVLTEIFKQIKIQLILIIALYICILPINFSPNTEKVLDKVFTITLSLQAILLVQGFIRIFIEIFSNARSKKNKNIKSVYQYFGGFFIAFTWIIGFILILSNLGFNVTSLVASLGIGGLAIALAVQSILKDILSNFIILINRPFQVGDTVKLTGVDEGVITKIGLKNTIIKTAADTELIVTNDDILNSRLYNFRSRKRRRVELNLNIDLDTNSSKIEDLKKELTKALTKEEMVNKDDVRVTVKGFTSQAIVLEVIYSIHSNSLDEYVKVNDKVNLKIKSIMEKEEVKFA